MKRSDMIDNFIKITIVSFFIIMLISMLIYYFYSQGKQNSEEATEASTEEIVADLTTSAEPSATIQNETSSADARATISDNSSENISPNAVSDKIYTTDEILDQFLDGEIVGYYDETCDSEFKVEDFIDDGEQIYTPGERVDLDNDGENELVVHGPYGGWFIDVRNQKLFLFAFAEGTADLLSYTTYEDAVWIVHEDTTHEGRQFYWLTKYEGGDNIVEEVVLSAEYWESSNDCYSEDDDFHYGDKEITMQEYEEIRDAILQNRVGPSYQ